MRWEGGRCSIRVIIYSGSVEDAEIRSMEIRCGDEILYSIEWNGEDRVTLQTRRNGVWQGKVCIESRVVPWFVKHNEVSERVEKDGVERTARDIIDFFIQLVNGIINGTLQPARASQ